MRHYQRFSTDIGPVLISAKADRCTPESELRVIPYSLDQYQFKNKFLRFVKAFIVILEKEPEIRSLELEITLTDMLTDGGHCTGQGLDALEWSSENLNITLGTEDSEYLALRAPWLNKGDANIKIDLKPKGITFSLMKKPANTEFSFHFVLAVSENDSNGNSDWFAVQVDHIWLLNQL